jgi:hypothetical protein
VAKKDNRFSRCPFKLLLVSDGNNDFIYVTGLKQFPLKALKKEITLGNVPLYQPVIEQSASAHAAKFDPTTFAFL